MTSPVPVPPKNLNPFARELLEALAGHPEAAEIVIGGGVALSHYLEYRGTVDLDAWWRVQAQEEVRRLLHAAMEKLAVAHGLQMRVRRFGETESYELISGSQKKFSFQISDRTRWLETPFAAKWPPLLIETFRDNLASKMTALVDRGAPRDFTDIHALCQAGVVTAPECWAAWREKHPGGSVREGSRKVILWLQMIEGRRPLEALPAADRAKAALVRTWVRDTLCRDEAHDY